MMEEEEAEREDELCVLEGVFGSDFERSKKGGALRVRSLAEALCCECRLCFEGDEKYPRNGAPSVLFVDAPDGSLPPEATDVLTAIARKAAARFAAEDGLCSMMRVAEVLAERLRTADSALRAEMAPAELARLLQLAADNDSDSADPMSASFFMLVPAPCVRDIFALLDGRSLARCACVCRQFRDVASDPALWDTCLKREFPAVGLSWHRTSREAYSHAWERISYSLKYNAQIQIHECKCKQERASRVQTVDPMKLRPSAEVYRAQQEQAASQHQRPFVRQAAKGDEDEDAKEKKKKKKPPRTKHRSPLGGRRYYNS